MRDVGQRSTALPVGLSGIGVFPGPPAILWAVPVVTPALLRMHAELDLALPGSAVDAHYRRDALVPHVTLSGPVQDAGHALSVLLARWRATQGVLNRVEVVRFRPVKVLASLALQA